MSTKPEWRCSCCGEPITGNSMIVMSPTSATPGKAFLVKVEHSERVDADGYWQELVYREVGGS